MANYASENLANGLILLYQSTPRAVGASVFRSGSDVLLFQSWPIFPNPDPDIVSPQISDIDPAPGSELTASTIVHFSISDDISLGFVEVQVEQSRREVVHDGDAFLYPYLESTREPITEGYRYHVQRTGGWMVGPIFKVRAFDRALNEGT